MFFFKHFRNTTIDINVDLDILGKNLILSKTVTNL